jgi:transposase, IS6 family
MRTRRPRLAPATRSAFAGFRFPPDVIVLAVRWYLRFGLSYRDVEELLASAASRSTTSLSIRWVQRGGCSNSFMQFVGGTRGADR